MMQLRKYVLSLEGIEYIRGILAKGLTLANYLQKRWDLENGRLSTFLPPHLSQEVVRRFDSGGVFPLRANEAEHFTDGLGRALRSSPVTSTEPHLIESVRSYLQDTPSSVAVFESPVAEPHYPWLQTQRKSRVMTHKDEVYHCIRGAEASGEAVGNVISEVGGLGAWPGLIGVLSRVDEAALRHWENYWIEVNASDLELIANCAEKIVIGAYDGEGYMIWEKPQ